MSTGKPFDAPGAPDAAVAPAEAPAQGAASEDVFAALSETDLERELSAWDAMAGLLLVDEAGGYTAPFPGPAGLGARAPVIATGPGVAAEVMAIVAAAR